MSRGSRTPAAGYTLVELLTVVALLMTIAGIAIPFALTMTERMRLAAVVREVERELQTARLKAVSANRSLQVRFNCPAAGQYRIVEVMNAGIDNTSERCSEAHYPVSVARDSDPASPDHDGPIRYLTHQVALQGGALLVLQFAPTGQTVLINNGTRQQIDPEDGAVLTLTKGTHTGVVNVNGLGRIRILSEQELLELQ